MKNEIYSIGPYFARFAVFLETPFGTEVLGKFATQKAAETWCKARNIEL